MQRILRAPHRVAAAKTNGAGRGVPLRRRRRAWRSGTQPPLRLSILRPESPSGRSTGPRPPLPPKNYGNSSPSTRHMRATWWAPLEQDEPPAAQVMVGVGAAPIRSANRFRPRDCRFRLLRLAGGLRVQLAQLTVDRSGSFRWA